MDAQYIFHWLSEMSCMKDFRRSLFHLTAALYTQCITRRQNVCALDAFILLSEKTQTESVVGELRQSGL